MTSHRWLLAAAGVFGLTAMLAAFGSFPNRRPDSQEGLVAIPESFDFGSVGSGENRMSEFQLHNDSDSDSILIHNVVVSCGCTVPKLVKNQLLSGERTTLKVFFRAPDERGPVQKTIRLDYQNLNDQSVHSLTLKLNAIIEPALSVTPPYLLLQPSSDSVLSGRVAIKVAAGAGRDDGQGTAVRVVRVTASHASIRPALSDAEEGWIVDVTMDPAAVNTKGRQMALVVEATREGGLPYFANVPVFVSSVTERDQP